MSFSAIDGSRVSLAVADTAVAIASVPTGAAYAEGEVKTASVVATREGTTPTSTVGKTYDEGDTIILRSRREILAFRVIRETSTSATIDWTFFTEAP